MSEPRLTHLRCPDNGISSQQQSTHRDTTALPDSNNSHMHRLTVNEPEIASKMGWAPVAQATGVRLAKSNGSDTIPR